ncbi:unnamed protein product [Paramecium pentaurelia]|uniref:EF-hand domain-containing protein n=1 Tax=Paramecium pentaurelia TaxID=43138 RepID=A0A8S1XFW2_9CILI|nr:unnamed protein product [Paramecium pentaurelia]
MYNYKIQVAPQINHAQSDHYYHPYSTLSYQSYTNKPTYLQQLANQKYYNDCYYQEKQYYPQADRQLFQIQKEQHYEYMTKLNKNLEFDFQTLKNKIETLSISYIEERELFQQMINEIAQQLRDIEKCKSNIVSINFSKLSNNITVIDLLEYLHQQDLKQIKKSDIELFFNSINQQVQQDYISKLKLQNLIGKDYLTKQEQDEHLDQIQARVLAMIIQTYTHLEFYRQKFKYMALKLDYIFNWLDFDRDGILSFADFKSRYPSADIVFKFFTQQSLDIQTFVKLLQPHSQAKYF